MVLQQQQCSSAIDLWGFDCMLEGVGQVSNINLLGFGWGILSKKHVALQGIYQESAW